MEGKSKGGEREGGGEGEMGEEEREVRGRREGREKCTSRRQKLLQDPKHNSSEMRSLQIFTL